jgi:hypothetical protein
MFYDYEDSFEIPEQFTNKFIDNCFNFLMEEIKDLKLEEHQKRGIASEEAERITNKLSKLVDLDVIAYFNANFHPLELTSFKMRNILGKAQINPYNFKNYCFDKNLMRSLYAVSKMQNCDPILAMVLRAIYFCILKDASKVELINVESNFDIRARATETAILKQNKKLRESVDNLVSAQTTLTSINIMLKQKKAELANLTIDYKTMYENLQKSTELHNMKITELEGTLNEYLKTIGQLNLQIETQKKMLKDEHTLTIKELTNKINDLTLKCNYFTNKELFKKINTGGLKEKKEKIEKLISDIVPKDVISNKISKLRITPENEKVLHHIFTHKQYDFLVKTDEQKSGKHAQLE